MARQKKNGTMCTFYIGQEIKTAIDRYSTDTGLPKTVIIEKAVEEYLQKRCVEMDRGSGPKAM